MTHNIKKTNLFNFLKSESVIEEINTNTISIREDKNTATLKKVIISNFNNTSTYWIMNPETKTFLQPNSKKVDGIILEHTSDGNLNIVLIELKSTSVTPSEIIEKFEKSLSWVYLLLNLLDGKEDQKIKVFGILVAQKNKNWNTKGNLQIFNSTSIRYIKRSFFTSLNEYSTTYNSLITPI